MFAAAGQLVQNDDLIARAATAFGRRSTTPKSALHAGEEDAVSFEQEEAVVVDDGGVAGQQPLVIEQHRAVGAPVLRPVEHGGVQLSSRRSDSPYGSRPSQRKPSHSSRAARLKR